MVVKNVTTETLENVKKNKTRQAIVNTRSAETAVRLLLPTDSQCWFHLNMNSYSTPESFPNRVVFLAKV